MKDYQKCYKMYCEAKKDIDEEPLRYEDWLCLEKEAERDSLGMKVKMRKNPISIRVYSGKTLNMVIKAVEDLLFYYQHPRSHRFDGLSCPLCHLFDCKYCLWVVFHHMCCDDFADKKFDTDAGSLKRNEEWRAFRVKELTNWLKELKRSGVKVVAGYRGGKQ